MGNKLFSVMLLLVALAALAGCRRAAPPAPGEGREAPQRGAIESIQVKGSDTMVNLGQAWAEALMKERSDVSVAITGGGSGTGIASLINGTTDIAQSSREMKPQEIEQARARGVEIQEHRVGLDALTVVVHPSNPVKRLTLSQLSAIYTGKLENWKQLGGPDRKIVTLSRDRNSGTHVFFLEHVVRLGNPKGREEFAPTVLMLPSSKAIADEEATNPDAIGYFGLGYLDTRRHQAVAVSSRPGAPYVSPSLENVLNGAYPIARPLYLYARKQPGRGVQAFVAFVHGSKGQQIVKTQGFVPLPQVGGSRKGGA